MSIPTDDAIHEAFDRTADAISGDLYGLSTDDIGEFKLDRSTVFEYLEIHGSREVSKHLWSLSPDEREMELDRIGVPKSWSDNPADSEML